MTTSRKSVLMRITMVVTHKMLKVGVTRTLTMSLMVILMHIGTLIDKINTKLNNYQKVSFIS